MLPTSPLLLTDKLLRAYIQDLLGFLLLVS
jgi:hypothetical protein